eukprot:TRINITY_DN3782_c0_g1_i3.p1 TRINITY_DN3782_c0_g1~~TRINITY_DN3782_c0_g1_i3.p1  ORF type:complete len:430 (+),score=139.15 TRINITY_DN3782_c0_g1_i3:615-1904(+)
MPFIGLKREVRNGVVSWKRFQREPLAKKYLEKLVEYKPDKVCHLPTEEKRVWLYAKFDAIKNVFDKEAVMLVVERQNLLRDSFEQLNTVTDLDLRKEIKIHFIDEAAHDAGGLIREWFSSVFEELLSMKLGLFQRANIPEISYVINENSTISSDYYCFFGQMLGKALFERIPIKAHLAKPLLKELLGEKLVVEDLKYFDLEIWKSVEFLRKHKLDKEEFVSTFSITKTGPDRKSKTIELKPGGKEISITEYNKEEFIQLLGEYYLSFKTKQQMKKLSSGFNSVIPRTTISVLDADELEFFLCGDTVIDLTDWQLNTIYKGHYSEDSKVIKWFWKVISELSDAERRDFLKYCTGSARTPAEGFKGLMSNSGKVCHFCIEPKEYTGESTAFIVAHTCFNRIELPEYPSLEMMRRCVGTVIENPLCATFGFE